MTNRSASFRPLLFVAMIWAALACASCDGFPPRAEAASPTPVPISVIMCDGVNTGTVRLTTVSVAGKPSFATQAMVASVGDVYTLVPGTTPLNSLVHVLASDGRHWHRMGIPNPEFLAAKFWSVGPGGNDEAKGWGIDHASSDAVRLATLGELNRRLVGFDGSYPGWYPDPPYALSGPSIHLTGDIDVASFAVLSNLQLRNSSVWPRIYGDMIPVDGGATDRTITAAQPAVPNTNTERTITIAGLGASVPQYVKKAVVSADGRKFAWVTRQTATDVLAISQPRISTFDQPPVLGWLLGTSGTISGADFVVGDHVSIYDMVTIPDWPFPANGIATPLIVHVRFGNHDSHYFARGDLGSSGPFITQCIWGYDGFQTSYNFIGGIATSGSPGVIVQPLFIGTHNSISNANWMLHSATAVGTVESPAWWNSHLQIAEELNITSGLFRYVERLEFPSQNNSAIAMFDITYPYGAFQFTPTDHHGGGHAEFYMGEGVVWYGHVAGAAMSLPPGAQVRLPVNTIYLDAPGSGAPGGPAGSGQIIVGAGSGIGVDPQITYKNFSNVPFFDAPTGTSVAGHQ